MKPDYSKVPAQYIDTRLPIDITLLIKRLEEIKVEFYPSPIGPHRYFVWSDYNEYNKLLIMYSSQCFKDEEINCVSIEDFLAPFEKIWKEWNEAQITPCDKFSKKQLIVPSDEEIEKYSYRYGLTPKEEKSLSQGAKWMREQIIKLNS